MSDQFQQWVSMTQNQFKKDFESAIVCRLPAYPSQLHEAIHYVIHHSGKMIRPLLTFATGKSLFCDYQSLLPLAIAIETIHVYSLIHDDLPAMDNDDLRRGVPTCHKAFDDATAILTGDALQAMAFQILGESQLSDTLKAQCMTALAKAAGVGGMVGGQMLDIKASGRENFSITLLDQLHRLKTGALIEASVMIPTMIAPPQRPSLQTTLASLSHAMGLAFQIQDDILDITQTTKDLGKPARSDIEQNKPTYPTILGLEQSNHRLQQIKTELLELINKIPEQGQYLHGLAQLIIDRQK